MRREPVLGALPDDFEGYVKLKTVREENGHGYHDFNGLRQPANGRTVIIGLFDGTAYKYFKRLLIINFTVARFNRPVPVYLSLYSRLS